VWLCSWSPLPYWSVRILAPLARYSMARYLLATFLARFPRFWFFASLGGLPVLLGKMLPFMMVAVALALLIIFAAPVCRLVHDGVARLRSAPPTQHGTRLITARLVTRTVPYRLECSES